MRKAETQEKEDIKENSEKNMLESAVTFLSLNSKIIEIFRRDKRLEKQSAI